jgi:hypothetical protein
MSSAAMIIPAAALTTADGDKPGHMTLGHRRRAPAPSMWQPAAVLSETEPGDDCNESKP